MERLVEDQEEDYIGKQALERIRRDDVRRKLVGIEIGDTQMPGDQEEFWPVLSHGGEVGHVTISVWSPRLEKNIGYAWVPIELSDIGTPLEVGWPFDGSAKAQVAALPFIDTRKAIPKA